jgi:hypothetical protein
LRSAEPTIIFLHIGKTGGTSLRRILRRQFHRREIIEFRAPLPPPGRLRREGSLEAFARMPEDQRAAARLVMGHTTYGIHDLIPRPSTYVTMLRDPVALVTSLHRYIRRTPSHLLHDEVVRGDLSLEAFVASGISVEVDNSQTRALAGDTTTPFGACDDAMLERAKLHVKERVAVAGLTERFDESLLLMRHAFGWSRTYYVASNTAPTGDRARPSDEAITLIRERNQLDVALHSWVRGRFDAALTAIPDAEAEVDRFKRRNRLFAPWGRLTVALPRQLASRTLGRNRRHAIDASP